MVVSPRHADPLTWACIAAVAVCTSAILASWARRLWRYRRRAVLAAEPQCLQCGYIIRPGSSVVCSECGSDVRDRGIVSPRTLPPLPAWPWYALALLLGSATGWELGAAAAEWQPFGWEFTFVRVVYLEGRLPSGAPYDGAAVFTVNADGNGRYAWRRADRVGVWSGRTQLGIEIVGRQSIGDARVGSKGPFDPLTVAALVNQTSPGAPAADREATAAAINQAVGAIADGDFPVAAGTTHGERWSQEVGYTLPRDVRRAISACCAAFAGLAAIGVVLRRRKRLRASLREQWRRAAAEMGLYDGGGAPGVGQHTE